MKKRLKTDPDFRRLSQIRDGSTVRFKVSAIEELARQLGEASDQGLPLAPISEDGSLGSDDFKVPTLEDKKEAQENRGRRPAETSIRPKKMLCSRWRMSQNHPRRSRPASSPPETHGNGQGHVGQFRLPGKSRRQLKGLSDSSTGSTDSDVRLDGKGKKPKNDEAAVPTEEIALDFSGPGSAVIKGGSSAKLSAPKAGGSSGKLAADASKHAPKPPADSSEFELSLDADGGGGGGGVMTSQTQE